MNKNLEQEYRELMAEDMSDLWDRIEAGLEPKEPVEERREQSGSRGGQSRRRRYGAWGIAAAAGHAVVAPPPTLIFDAALPPSPPQPQSDIPDNTIAINTANPFFFILSPSLSSQSMQFYAFLIALHKRYGGGFPFLWQNLKKFLQEIIHFPKNVLSQQNSRLPRRHPWGQTIPSDRTSVLPVPPPGYRCPRF